MSHPPAQPTPSLPPPDPAPGLAPHAVREPRRAVGPGRRARLPGLLALLTAALVAVGLAARWGPWKKPPASPGDRFPLPPVSSSPFLNTGPEARYVGSDACRECHAGSSASFRRTGMGRSMAEVDLSREPPDAGFDHPPSKRRYQVVRKGGQLWHRELLLAEGPAEVVLAEYPVKYVVGSGRHSLTYLVEADGFLVESPVTWYTSRQAWGMSPGYDRPNQSGFERAVGESCLTCHAGRAEAVGGSLHRMHVGEAAIGCERCHGPGSLHVARHAGRDRPAGGTSGIDYTVVNPAHLSRELAEAVCQQCHLRTSAVVVARGRKPSAFRPGLPLQDFLHAYRLESPDAPMTVVGHVEQMHLSRCYQSSDALTCLTCHDPHGEPRPKDRADYYNSVCVGCHRPERCTVSADRRQKESPENDCVHCHMPRSPTEIPHLAFTHHRIGIHDRPPPASQSADEETGRGQLRPFLDLSRLGDVDRKRSLGLGYLEVANRHKDPELAARYRQQALGLMSEARAAGLRDGTLDASLARLRFDMGLDDVLLYAAGALEHPDLDGQERCNALFLLADGYASQGRYAEAVAILRELHQLRRHALTWLLLAKCEEALGHQAAAEEALESAVRSDPRLWEVHEYLAKHYRRQGDEERATWHQQRAVP
jgi:predicted CXXCH cytochrome family protein